MRFGWNEMEHLEKLNGRITPLCHLMLISDSLEWVNEICPSPSHSSLSMVEVREKVQIRALVAGMFVIMQQSGEFEQKCTSNFMEVVLSNRSLSKLISSAPSIWRWRSKWPSSSVLICICSTEYPVAFIEELFEIEVQSHKKDQLMAND